MAINEFINYFENDDSFDEKRIYLPKDSVSYVAETHEVSYKTTEAFNYRFLEYIENTSTAYIDTGIKGSGGQRVECTFMPITQLSNYFNCVYGARTTPGSKHDGIYIYHTKATNNTGYVAYNTTSKNLLASAYASLNEIHEIIQDKGTFTLDGNLVHTFTNTTFTCTNATIYIFNANNNGTLADYRGLFRLYSFKLYNSSGELVRDMIPAQRISDGVYGLYDNVTNQFYTSPNGTLFTGS